MAKKLTDKQQRFCEEFIIDLNATQAAIRAKYSAKTAQAQSSRLLSNVMVQERISELKANRSERTAINADYVLNRHHDIDQLDVLDILDDNHGLKPIREWPKAWRISVSGIEISELFEGRGEEREHIGFLKKIKFPDKIKNLELLGKHVGVNAYTHVETESEEDAPPISIVYDVSEAVGDIKVTIGRDKVKATKGADDDSSDQ